MPSNVNILITKFDKVLESATVVVGFRIMTNNGKTLFIDKDVPIPTSESGITDSQIIDSAWAALSSTIQQWIDANTNVLSPVGMMYTPPGTQTETVSESGPTGDTIIAEVTGETVLTGPTGPNTQTDTY
jgi:hypothetical protein